MSSSDEANKAEDASGDTQSSFDYFFNNFIYINVITQIPYTPKAFSRILYYLS